MAWREDAKITKFRCERLFYGSGLGTEVQNPVGHIASASLHLAHGETTCGATTSVDTGLSTILGAWVSIKASALTATKPKLVTWVPSAGILNFKGWASGISATPVAASTEATIDWLAIGR